VVESLASQWLSERGVEEMLSVRLGWVLDIAGMNPAEAIRRIERYDADGTSMWRFFFKDGVVYEPAAEHPDMDECWLVQGYHATDISGALGILTDREIRGMPWPYGVGEHGIYLRPAVPGPRADSYWKTMLEARKGGKNTSGILFEVDLLAPFKRLRSGGTVAEQQFCEQGTATHYKQGDEDRWAVPARFVRLRGFWAEVDSLSDLASSPEFLRRQHP
jgi:hypothetical protein